jgi:hypothetical protein
MSRYWPNQTDREGASFSNAPENTTGVRASGSKTDTGREGRRETKPSRETMT